MRCFWHFDLEICFAPQGRFHLSSGQMAPHRPETTFRASGATKHWKLENTVFRDFTIFSRACIFFLLRIFFFSDFSHLCFTSKLPLLNIPLQQNHHDMYLPRTWTVKRPSPTAVSLWPPPAALRPWRGLIVSRGTWRAVAPRNFRKNLGVLSAN